jgi:hypothetical protein
MIIQNSTSKYLQIFTFLSMVLQTFDRTPRTRYQPVATPQYTEYETNIHLTEPDYIHNPTETSICLLRIFTSVHPPSKYYRLSNLALCDERPMTTNLSNGVVKERL